MVFVLFIIDKSGSVLLVINVGFEFCLGTTGTKSIFFY